MKAKTQTALKRIEGQVRGIAKMVEEDRYCIDVLMQIEAARSALNRVAGDLLRQHVNHCVGQAMRSPKADERQKVVDELMQVIERRS